MATYSRLVNGVSKGSAIDNNFEAHEERLNGLSIGLISDMVADTSLSVGMLVNTNGYYEDGVGSNTYEIVAAATGADDGGSYIDLTGSGLQAKGLFPAGVHVDQFGAKSADQSFDNKTPFLNAAVYARSLSTQVILGGVDNNAKVDVILSGGSSYFLFTTVNLNLEGVRVNFVCENGTANILGATTAAPTVKNVLGFSFTRVFRSIFKGINFSGFTQIHSWSEAFVDSCTVDYIDCDFNDSGTELLPAIDTRSYADSGSCVLTFSNCRAAGTPYLVDSYCDILKFNGGSYRNGSATRALVQADSGVCVDGGIWTPFFVGNDARWFDLYDAQVTGSRGITVQGGARFGPEGGGIPVVKNFMDGENIATNHQTNFINFYGCSVEAAPNTGTHDCIVMLAESGGESIAPSIIGFYGASAKSKVGLVRTESGSAVNKARGRFAIDISNATQSHLTDAGTAVTVPLVDPALNEYLVSDMLYKAPNALAIGVDESIDISVGGRNPTFKISGSSSSVLAMTGAFNGETVTLIFDSNSMTVKDFSSGSRLFLSGGVNFTANRFSSITLRWDRAGTKWVEISRSTV